MSSITCGNCKQTHANIAEVKACYATVGKSQPATFGYGGGVGIRTLGDVDTTLDSTKYGNGTLQYKTPKTFVRVPESKYALAALPGHNNDVTFFSVKNGKKGGKWESFQFVTRLVGHPGSFAEYPVKGDAKAIILRKIADDARGAAKKFADEFSVCARCGSPLTDDTSRAMGLGPDCRKAF